MAAARALPFAPSARMPFPLPRFTLLMPLPHSLIPYTDTIDDSFTFYHSTYHSPHFDVTILHIYFHYTHTLLTHLPHIDTIPFTHLHFNLLMPFLPLCPVLLLILFLVCSSSVLIVFPIHYITHSTRSRLPRFIFTAFHVSLPDTHFLYSLPLLSVSFTVSFGSPHFFRSACTFTRYHAFSPLFTVSYHDTAFPVFTSSSLPGLPACSTAPFVAACLFTFGLPTYCVPFTGCDYRCVHHHAAPSLPFLLRYGFGFTATHYTFSPFCATALRSCHHYTRFFCLFSAFSLTCYHNARRLPRLPFHT